MQLKALAIHYFSISFNELERLVKSLFKDQLSLIDSSHKSLLYFLLAGIKQSPHIDYNSNSLKTDPCSFSINEDFAKFSFSQIIKIQRQNHIFDSFEFNIPSINNKTVEYGFVDCCDKLICTRNKIAHEISNISFSNKEIIEILPISQIQTRSSALFFEMDSALMDSDTLVIISNLIFMEQMIAFLKERGSADEH